MGTGENLRQQSKRNNDGAAPARITPPIATSGEVFLDGSIVELVGGERGGNPRLWLWDGATETIGSLIKYAGATYESVQFPDSLLRESKLPSQCRVHGTTPQLLAEICKLVEDFAGLPARSASLVSRFVLSGWLFEALPVAPALVLTGPDLMRTNQLVTLLHCLCRRGLRMTGVTPAGLRSLPSGAGFALLISQPINGDSRRIDSFRRVLLASFHPDSDGSGGSAATGLRSRDAASGRDRLSFLASTFISGISG